MRRVLFLAFIFVLIVVGIFLTKNNILVKHSFGDKIDSLHGVYVYYNGGVGNVNGRSKGVGGYNIGLKYQCVEFVKRYYYEHLNHKMPNSYGNAIDYFDVQVSDGQLNANRNLIQYSNPSKWKPKVGDLMIYKGTSNNKYGHVSIVSKVLQDEIEIIQQNAGQYSSSRDEIEFYNENAKWKIDNKRIIGWLRLKD